MWFGFESTQRAKRGAADARHERAINVTRRLRQRDAVAFVHDQRLGERAREVHADDAVVGTGDRVAAGAWLTNTAADVMMHGDALTDLSRFHAGTKAID